MKSMVGFALALSVAAGAVGAQQTPMPGMSTPGGQALGGQPTGRIEEITLNGDCTLSYKGRVYAQGPCQGVLINNRVTEVMGTMAESGLGYRAQLSQGTRSGILFGAETFILGEGPLVETEAGARYVWSSGYALDVVFGIEE